MIMKNWLARVRSGRHMQSTLPVRAFDLITGGVRNDHARIRDINFLALDLELTGLDPESDHIVSIGWVPIRQLRISLEDSAHYLVKSSKGVGQSAVIHGIHDYQVDRGLSLHEVLAELSARYADHVIIAHHAVLDMAFLDKGMREHFGTPMNCETVDTMLLEKRRLENKGLEIHRNSLRLASCMIRNGLPVSRQHDALADAFSCAQLFLCQMHQSGKPNMSLAQLRSISR